MPRVHSHRTSSALFAGDIYQGPVVASQPCGHGEWRSGVDGSTYLGQFDAGKRHGQGALKLADGGVMEGEWLNGELEGYAEISLADGFRYSGLFQLGQRHGNGIAYYPSGASYDGEWRCDLRCGHGLWVAGASVQSGAELTPADEDETGEVPTRYVGQWAEGRRRGRGSLSYLSGASYVGDFGPQELYDGHGVLCASDGSKYDGQWQEGTHHGKGMRLLQGAFRTRALQPVITHLSAGFKLTMHVQLQAF